MPYCTHCGAPIRDGTRFCTQCGAQAKAPPPVKTRRRDRPMTPLLQAAALCAVVLSLSLGAFALGAAPSRETVRGTLDRFFDAAERGDARAVVACIDPEQDRDDLADALDGYSGTELVTDLLVLYGSLDGYGDALSGVKHVRVVTVTNDWNKSGEDRQTASLLLEVSDRHGTGQYALEGISLVRRNGLWYISTSFG